MIKGIYEWRIPLNLHPKVETINHHHYIRVKYLHKYVRKLLNSERKYRAKCAKYKSIIHKLTK